MKYVKLFEQFLNEAARLRSQKDWEDDIADEISAIVSRDDSGEVRIFQNKWRVNGWLKSGWFQATYDGKTGFDIVLYNNREKKVGSAFQDCDGYGSTEIIDAIYGRVEYLKNKKKRQAKLDFF